MISNINWDCSGSVRRGGLHLISAYFLASGTLVPVGFLTTYFFSDSQWLVVVLFMNCFYLVSMTMLLPLTQSNSV